MMFGVLWLNLGLLVASLCAFALAYPQETDNDSVPRTQDIWHMSIVALALVGLFAVLAIDDWATIAIGYVAIAVCYGSVFTMAYPLRWRELVAGIVLLAVVYGGGIYFVTEFIDNDSIESPSAKGTIMAAVVVVALFCTYVPIGQRFWVRYNPSTWFV